MKTILVVDDDDNLRLILKHHLEGFGFSVIESSSGDGVVGMIAEHKPVACLIDIVMDEKEGIETIVEITSTLASPPRIIAISSNPMYLDLVGELGADGILQKPISRPALQGKLNELGIVA